MEHALLNLSLLGQRFRVKRFGAWSGSHFADKAAKDALVMDFGGRVCRFSTGSLALPTSLVLLLLSKRSAHVWVQVAVLRSKPRQAWVLRFCEDDKKSKET